MASVNIRSLTFGYDADLIFEDLNFSFDTDWKLGFVGRNGRGKTTLMRLISGQLRPLSGTIENPLPCNYFPYALAPDALALDALTQALPHFEDWEIFRELNKLQVDAEILYRPVSTLSGGERTKLMLAGLFAGPDSFLLIDEPTDHLDALGREIMAAYLAGKKGFLLVSHDRHFLDLCTDHTLSLNKTGLLVEKGNYSSFAHNQRQRDEFERQTNEKLAKEIAQIERSQREKRQWSDNIESSKIGGHVYDRGFVGHQSARMMQRAISLQKRQQRMIEEKEELLRDIEYASALKVTPLRHDKRIFISGENLTLGYEDKPVITGLNFHLEQNERLAVTGPNGCGKSTLIKAALGQLTPMVGQLYVAPRLTISYVGQETFHLCGSVQDFARSQGVDLSKYLMLLRKLDFPRAQFERDIGQMSAGQKKKVLLAASLCTDAHLYVWDEPLNFVDIMSREQIEELILSSNPTMLLIEHDSTFLHNIGCRMLPLN